MADPLQREGLRIHVRRKGGTGLLRSQEVEAQVADLEDCVAWTAEGPQQVDDALRHREEPLKVPRFLRVNRHILVNLETVREALENDEIFVSWARGSASCRGMAGLRMSLDIAILF